jgi:undecaprenyl-phosphate galactose phosphotransferase/putative colanic acid biosynthesis UDP-glucose lipid carrier transferase
MDMSAHDIGINGGINGGISRGVNGGINGDGPRSRRHALFSGPLSVRSLGLIVGAVDFLVILAAALASALIYHGLVLRAGIQVDRYVAIATISFINFAVIMGARGSYGAERLLDGRRDWREVALLWGVVVLVTLGLLFAGKVGGNVSRGAVGLFFLAGLGALLMWRSALARWTVAALGSGALGRRPVVLLASRGELAHVDAVATLERAGILPSATLIWDGKTPAERFAVLIDRAIEITRQQEIEAIVVLADWSEPQRIAEIQQALRAVPVPVHLLPDRNVARFMGGFGGRTRPAWRGLGGGILQRAPLGPAERAVKRTFDVAVAAAGLLALSPLLAVVAVAVKLDSRGPVLFRQTRNGFSGRPFRILKFRTMTVAEDGDAFRQAQRNDPRVTRVGRLLRKTSIDELPQLWNVLAGDMSIVGPRPHATKHNAEYQERIGAYAYRHHVKPGLTGWAQVNGCRGETATLSAMERRIEHDLYYVNHWSFLLDLRIVAKTLAIIWSDEQAV